MAVKGWSVLWCVSCLVPGFSYPSYWGSNPTWPFSNQSQASLVEKMCKMCHKIFHLQPPLFHQTQATQHYSCIWMCHHLFALSSPNRWGCLCCLSDRTHHQLYEHTLLLIHQFWQHKNRQLKKQSRNKKEQLSLTCHFYWCWGKMAMCLGSYSCHVYSFILFLTIIL